MSKFLPQLADFLDGEVGNIIKTWAEAVAVQPGIDAADNLTYRQLVDHLPYLCHDLAERLRWWGKEKDARAQTHAHEHGRFRWEQGYRMDELIRESGILRRVLTVNCLEGFASAQPEFDSRIGREVEVIMHSFLDEMLAESARQYAEEKDKTILATEQHRSAILESALDCIIVMDERGEVREWNPAAEELFGYTREQAMGRELVKLVIPPALRENHREGLANFRADKEGPLFGRRIEMPAMRADGNGLLVELAITPYTIEGKSVFTAYLRDITQRKEDEEASQRLAAIVESSDDAIVSKDLNGIIKTWNHGAKRMFGYTAQEIIGRPITTLIPPELHHEEREIIDRIRRGIRTKQYETIRRRKDGSLFNISVTVSPVREKHGHIVGASKIARDITERVQREARRDAQYTIAGLTAGQQSLDETIPQILAAVARTGTWKFAAFWTKSDKGKLVAQGTWQASAAYDRFAAETRALVLECDEGLAGRAFSSGTPETVEDLSSAERLPRRKIAQDQQLRGAFVFPLRGSSGINGAIELVSDNLLSPDSDLVHFAQTLGIQIGLYVERKQTESELRRQKEAAETANQAKDRFLAALSHELRTPLNPVLMWACAMSEDQTLESGLREDVEMIRRNVELEARLIDDLLDLTRISQGKLQLKLQPCRVDELVRHAVDIVRSQIEAKNLQISLEFGASNHQMLADPTRIQQVFWNLLKNAQKFTPPHGQISVRSYDSAPGVLAIEVSDSGRGIDPELMPKLFVAFEQGDSAGEGLGLGLAICKAIVRMHGGKIAAASKAPGTGATFTVELSTVAGKAVPVSPAAQAQPAPWKKLCILIVEDHEHTAAVMSKLLRRAGHDVSTAATVQEAVALLRSTSFDVLVSDLGLPDGNGFQVMRELAKRGRAKGIAISGYGMEEDVARSSEAGFSAHLTKPIDAEHLQEVIQQVIHEP